MRKGLTTLLVMLVLASGVAGCARPASGSVSGLTIVVGDLAFGPYPAGYGVGGVPVKIIAADGSTSATVTADHKGRFHADLPPGRYVLRASCGHGVATDRVTVNSGKVAKTISTARPLTSSL